MLVLAAAFVRYPAAAPVALLVVAPFRLSVGLGSQEAFLLLPLYAVLAAAAAALAYRVIRGGEFPAVPYLIAGPTAALVALSGISLLWAKDLRAGTIELVFFYFPFAMLLSILALTRTRDWTWRALATALVAVTSLFAAIGVYQAWSHTEILAKQDVQLTNAYSAFFRVTSVFQDPSVYGRHLVLGIVVLLTVLWLGRVRPAIGLPVLGLLTLGLYFSYSQTSFVALFCGVLVVALLAGDKLTRRVVVGVSAGLLLAAGVVVLAEGRRRFGTPGDERPDPDPAGDLAGVRRSSGRRRGHRLAAAHEPPGGGRAQAEEQERLAYDSAHRRGRARNDRAHRLPRLPRGPRRVRSSRRGAATGRSASRSPAVSPRSSSSPSSTAASSRIRSSGGSPAWRPRR